MFNTYLLDWGKMHRVYPRRHRKQLVSRLHTRLPMLMHKYRMLRKITLTSGGFYRARHHIESFYDELSNVGITATRRRIRIGPTAAAKLLHFIYPDLFVIWDKRWVRKPQRYGDTPSEYYRYLSDKKETLDEVTKKTGKTSKEAVKWLIVEHSLDLKKLGFPPVREPITKLLDEINFGGKKPSD
jgi:hypothetical protein